MLVANTEREPNRRKEERKFVYDSWSTGDAKCPVNQAGLIEAEGAERLAAQFDSVVRSNVKNERSRFLSETEARIYWDTVINNLEELLKNDNREGLDEYIKEELRLAREVKERNSW